MTHPDGRRPLYETTLREYMDWITAAVPVVMYLTIRDCDRKACARGALFQ